ncbi:TetR/AcrR family transcriptional regulator [Streptomyces sp. CB02460]|uniref:TetR/AcrR family transcriptional regulator n=1 Tax=Streptomyces sp. CB02460 TaxID=1703941 RepID=UPI00093AC440|nr:TetR/AcrR family transcriptional regulator [Streptomyces sp. CB02460]
MHERSVRTREAILSGAAEVFGEKGYLGTRLEDVAARRRLSKGAVYFHFASKTDLAKAVIARQADLVPRLIGRLRPRFPQAAGLLTALAQEVARLLADDPEVRGSFRLLAERGLVDASVDDPFAAWSAAVEDVLRDAERQGAVPAGTRSAAVAGLVVSALVGLHHMGEGAVRPKVPGDWPALLGALLALDSPYDARTSAGASAPSRACM